jgi:hypothetical protein
MATGNGAEVDTEMLLKFRVHWTLGCSKGTGGCSAKLDLMAPKGRNYRTSVQSPTSLAQGSARRSPTGMATSVSLG